MGKVEQKLDNLENKINSIYLNIISLMSIFVSVFALIVVNANISFELTQENIKNTFKGIIILNVFVIICIIALLIGTRLIIMSPILPRKKG